MEKFTSSTVAWSSALLVIVPNEVATKEMMTATTPNAMRTSTTLMPLDRILDV
jgi:hypothetical protein